ncbi:MAG TPA: KH domain-containing protein [Elusimicrobiota bacterium]|nr:KH domain-containing protein [Elusimicrobiota bacterium]
MASPLEFVLSIVQCLVDSPEKVVGRWVESPEGGRVDVRVAPEDRGKVIGKGGRNIQSLRRLVSAAFAKDNQRIGVELAE